MRCLVLLPADDTGRQASCTPVGGLWPIHRTSKLALRAGFDPVDVGLGRPGNEPVFEGDAPVLLVAANFLPDASWLERVRKDDANPPRSLRYGDGRAAVLVAASDLLILDGAAAPPEGPHDGAARLGPSRLEIRPAPEGAFVTTEAERKAAERRLFAALVKDTEGFMSRHVERPISLSISKRLMNTAVTPNQMTLSSLTIGLVGAALFALPGRGFALAGALLFLLHSILDGCDGELARLKLQESRWGGLLDFWGDNVVHSAVFAGIGIGWAREAASAWPLALALAAVLGTGVSATLVYVHTLRRRQGPGPLYTSVSAAAEPPSALVRIADALSRRDFIYLVVILAALGRIRDFLVLAALGAPAYAVALGVIGYRDRRRG